MPVLGMFMVVAVGFIMRLAMFIPRIDMLEEWPRSWFEEEHWIQESRGGIHL